MKGCTMFGAHLRAASEKEQRVMAARMAWCRTSVVHARVRGVCLWASYNLYCCMVLRREHLPWPTTDGASPRWRGFSIRSVRAYSMVSDDAVMVVAELPPIDLMTLERCNTFQASSGASGNVPTAGAWYFLTKRDDVGRMDEKSVVLGCARGQWTWVDPEAYPSGSVEPMGNQVARRNNVSPQSAVDKARLLQ